ncbi:hypothetical protein SteCoe_17046 [Stentor coeruleus]|uniref:DOMON domain-containing protein n=1 Tax=Stentor coeruleus TaxID=5963 RepID=A0A1R2BZW2_9CILI|nr:hypothetical protein SteCoe_17046 [Stentor coeruleus]
MIILALLVLVHNSYSLECQNLSISISFKNSTFDLYANKTFYTNTSTHDYLFRVPASENSLRFIFSNASYIKSYNFSSEDMKKSEKYRWVSTKLGKIDNDFLNLSQKCSTRQGTANIMSNITFITEDCGNIMISWVKQCGFSEVLKGLSIGFDESSSEIAKNGEISSAFNKESYDKHFIISEEETSTVIFFKLEPGYEDLWIEKPYKIHTAVNQASPELEGELLATNLITSKPQKLKIIYNCHSSKEEYFPIIIVVEIPFLKSLNIALYKQCPWVDEHHKSWVQFVAAFVLVMIMICGMIGYLKYIKGQNLTIATLSQNIQNFVIYIQTESLSHSHRESSNENLDIQSISFSQLKSQYGTAK